MADTKKPHYGYLDLDTEEKIIILTDEQAEAVAERRFVRAMNLGVPFDKYMLFIGAHC